MSRDLNPATVLFELKRVGAVAVKADRVTLLKDSYVPAAKSIAVRIEAAQ